MDLLHWDGIQVSFISPLAGRFFTTEPSGKPSYIHYHILSRRVYLKMFSQQLKSDNYVKWRMCKLTYCSNKFAVYIYIYIILYYQVVHLEKIYINSAIHRAFIKTYKQKSVAILQHYHFSWHYQMGTIRYWSENKKSKTEESEENRGFKKLQCIPG